MSTLSSTIPGNNPMKTARDSELDQATKSHGGEIMRTARLLLLTASLAAVHGVCLADPPARSDAWYRQRLVGSWKGSNFGEQTLTNHADGTARLDVVLNRLAALRYGRSLQLQLTWTVEKGIVRHKVTGGSPPEKVARLINDFGDSLEYRIVDVRDSHLLLSELDNDESRKQWDAAPQIASNP
jgi:hypothetical protein